MMTLLRSQFPADDFSILAVVLGLPLLGALVNGLFGKRLGKDAVRLLALAAVGGSFIAAVVAMLLVATHPTGGEHATAARLTWNVWRWFTVTGRGGVGVVPIDVSFSLDALSATMALVVTGIGFLIHLYSTGYMAKDPGYHRFFAYLNLFIFAMLILILGDNLAVLFVGWEGVGLCSYLLIGFWFEDEAKAAAGKKAFITNRIGDFGLLVAMAMLIYHAGTLRWSELESGANGLAQMVQIWPIGRLEQTALPSFLVAWLTPDEPVRVYVTTLIALALFLGCAGKSAQIPLYVWLPDAMAGPTPVSALIHAATMVTAGVYLVARTSFLFVLSPAAMATVATVGAATALVAATIAFAQNDLKKVLAYSTVSQLGFMFIGVGVGAFGAGFFHVLTHAFFKGCLFLCAGSVIHAMHARLHDENAVQDMRRMGALRKYLPVTHATFLVSCLAIAGCPPLAGFWSKDELLWKAFSTRVAAKYPDQWVAPEWFGTVIFAVGILAALGTAFYMFRAYFMTFWGDFKGWKIVHRWRAPKHAAHGHDDHHHAEPDDWRQIEGPKPVESPLAMTLPLVVLAVGAGLVGFLYAEPIHVAPLEHFLHPVFQTAAVLVKPKGVESLLWPMMMFGVGAFVVGAGSAAYVYYSKGGAPARAFTRAGLGRWLHQGASAKWKVDELYEATVIGLLDAMGETAAQFDKWVIDGVIAKLTALLVRLFGTALRAVQTGRVQVYAASMVVGLAGVGWFFVTPQAEASIDDAKLQRSGKVTFRAAPGLGYEYRWTPEGATPNDRFDGGTELTLDLAACERKAVRLEVRNSFKLEAAKSFSVCRMVPSLAGCCGPDTAPIRAPSTTGREPPKLDPGTHDAGILQEILVPGSKGGGRAAEPGAPSERGGRP